MNTWNTSETDFDDNFNFDSFSEDINRGRIPEDNTNEDFDNDVY
jgi:hypothetical protein